MSNKFTLTEMIIRLNEEADYIQQCEDAAIITGHRVAPEPARVQKLECFRATARFLDRIQPKLNAVNAVLRDQPRGEPHD